MIPSAEPLSAGRGAVDGRYTIVRQLGTGGMGWVFLARDESLDGELVALKFLYPHLIVHEQSFSRFRNEVLVARKLIHPHIVRTYNIGVCEEGAYISLEYVDGRTLREEAMAAPSCRVSLERVMSVMQEMCSAVSYAHQSGILHRDIKPDNVLIGVHGTARMSDFGIAGSLRRQCQLTRSGQILGTPYYMAPELFTGQAASVQSDIYALGVTAFELLAGTRPYDEPSLFALAKQHSSSAIPEIADGISEPVMSIIRRCMAKEPEERYSSADELLEAWCGCGTSPLETLARLRVGIVKSDTTDNAPASRKRRKVNRRKRALLSALLVFGLLLEERGNPWARQTLSLPVLLAERAVGVKLTVLRVLLRVNATLDRPLADEMQTDNSSLWIRLAAGDDPNDPKNRSASDQATPLHRAMDRRPIEHLRQLLAYGAQPDAVQGDGNTPLHVGIQLGEWEKVLVLLQHGANPNLKNVAGQTPLTIYSSVSREPQPYNVLRSLLANGADPTLKDGRRFDALTYAAWMGFADVLAIMLDSLPDRGASIAARLLTVTPAQRVAEIRADLQRRIPPTVENHE